MSQQQQQQPQQHHHLHSPPQYPQGSSTQSTVHKRKRAATACLRCRQRRTKCDANFPTCSSCANVGSICEWSDPNIASSKRRADEFEQRIRWLEDIVMRFGIHNIHEIATGIEFAIPNHQSHYGPAGSVQGSQGYSQGPVWPTSQPQQPYIPQMQGSGPARPERSPVSMGAPFATPGQHGYNHVQGPSMASINSQEASYANLHSPAQAQHTTPHQSELSPFPNTITPHVAPLSTPRKESLHAAENLLALRDHTGNPAHYVGGSSGINVYAQLNEAAKQQGVSITTPGDEKSQVSDHPTARSQTTINQTPGQHSGLEPPFEEDDKKVLDLHYLPPQQDIAILLTAFVQELIPYPLLTMEYLADTVERVYNQGSPVSEQPSTDEEYQTEQDHLPEDKESSAGFISKNPGERDSFILNIAFAIGSSVLYKTQDAEAYYQRALYFFNHPPRFGLAKLQEMILLGLFTHLEPEITSGEFDGYSLTRTIITNVCALGIHREMVCRQSSDPQLSKRIFWCAFSLDRKVSSGLGRPTALADRAIDVSLFDENSEMVIADKRALPFDGSSWNLGLSKQMVKLRQITSSILVALHEPGNQSRPGIEKHLQASLDKWRMELKQHYEGNVGPPSSVGARATSIPISGVNYQKRPMLDRIRTYCELAYHEHLMLIYRPLALKGADISASVICLTSASQTIRNAMQLRQRSIPLSKATSKQILLATATLVWAFFKCEKSTPSVTIFSRESIVGDVESAIVCLEAVRDRWSESGSDLDIINNLYRWVSMPPLEASFQYSLQNGPYTASSNGGSNGQSGQLDHKDQLQTPSFPHYEMEAFAWFNDYELAPWQTQFPQIENSEQIQELDN